MTKNKKKKKHKKATLKMTHMSVIIKEEPNSPTIKMEEDEFSDTMIDETAAAMIIKNDDFNAPTMGDRSRTTTTGTTGEEEQEVLIPPGNFDIDGGFTTSNTTEEEEEVEKSNNYYDNIDKEILRNESNSTTAMITKNQVMPTIIEDKFNHDKTIVSNRYYGSIDNKIF